MHATVLFHAGIFSLAVTFGAQTQATQTHAHQTSGTQTKAKPAASNQKPATADTQKPNRPKPENQPGAVADAEKLAASHADHHEMRKLKGAGVLPDGWRHRFDLPTMKLEDVRVRRDSENVHVTSGPPGIYYDPRVTATGEYTVRATFTQLEKGEHREGYGPFIGGADLDRADQRYLYFLVRQDGRFLIKERAGASTRGVVDWTTHPAIRTFSADGRMGNELAITVDGKNVRFLINGVQVAQQPRAQLPVDGIVGLRINHQLDVLVENLSVAK